MTNTTIIGIDLAKSIFYLHAIDQAGHMVFRKKIKRADLLSTTVQLEPSVIAMEACGTSNYWARQFKQQGHTVKIIHAKYVKAFRQKNKNDYNDAQAIAEAASRPKTNCIPMKSVSQQEMQSLHRFREGVLRMKTAQANRIRGILLEFGVAIPRSHAHLKANMMAILEDAENELTDPMRAVLQEEYEHFLLLIQRVAAYDKRIQASAKNCAESKRLMAIPGVGPLIATYLYCCIGDASAYKNGRAFSAVMGFTPREYSTGGRQKIIGIGNRGNKYLRRILVQGVKSAMLKTTNSSDRIYKWANHLLAQRKHKNNVTIAVANKILRTALAMVKNKTVYGY